MPAVRRFITNMTGQQPALPEESGVDPDEAVALGAAVQVTCDSCFHMQRQFCAGTLSHM
jgi:molecular chaperone DnaK (HSP70)